MSAKNKIDGVMVGNIGHKVVYIQYFLNSQPMKNQLWKLEHPGNKTLHDWESQSIGMEDDELKVNGTFKTEMFFKECVKPVDGNLNSMIPLERELTEKYGQNHSGKILDIDSLNPVLYKQWLEVQKKFFRGDLFVDIFECEIFQKEESPENTKTESPTFAKVSKGISK